jgi:hypothetical protein
MSTTQWGARALVCLVLSAAGCSDGSEDEKGASSNSASADQTPPMGADKVEAWLAKGAYLKWHCESAPHMFRAPSPHGFNRICSNDLLADKAKGTGDWPKGAAAVKELYAAADDKDPVGYAVYLKTEADSADGANWYWYERVPLDHPAPHDAAGVVADGMGDDGPAKAICVGCHVAAGSDPVHTPSAGGRDQVYTPVP